MMVFSRTLIKSARNTFTLSCVWLFSAVAFSNGSSTPDLKIIDQGQSSADYPILRELHEITLELQMLELDIKNRRNPRIESKMAEAMAFIKNRGRTLESQLQVLKRRQTIHLAEVVLFAKRYSSFIHINESNFDDTIRALMAGEIREGALSVQGTRPGVPFVLANLSPLRIGSQFVWQVSTPDSTSQNYWEVLRSMRHSIGVSAGVLSEDQIRKRFKFANELHKEAIELIRAYQEESHQKLYAAFEDHRYGLFQRLASAHRSLITLSKSNTAMGAPEEIGALYNQVLQQFLSYGVNVSIATERDFSIQGFLFAPSQAEAQRLFEKMRFTPTANSYNSPSS